MARSCLRSDGSGTVSLENVISGLLASSGVNSGQVNKLTGEQNHIILNKTRLDTARNFIWEFKKLVL